MGSAIQLEAPGLEDVLSAEVFSVHRAFLEGGPVPGSGFSDRFLCLSGVEVVPVRLDIFVEDIDGALNVESPSQFAGRSFWRHYSTSSSFGMA